MQVVFTRSRRRTKGAGFFILYSSGYCFHAPSHPDRVRARPSLAVIVEAIAQAFGLRHVGGVSSAIAGVKAKLAEKDVATVVVKIEKSFNTIKLS